MPLMLVLAVLSSVACGSSGTPTAAGPALTRTPHSTSTARITPTTPAPSPTGGAGVTGLAAIFCPPVTAGGWLAVDVAARRIAQKPVVEADCTASNVDQIFTFSRDFARQAIVSQGTTGVSAGYVPPNQSDAVGFVDASGVISASSNASTPIFNPVSGQLWWAQDGALYSSTVPPTTPVNHGPGLLFSFTVGGQAMPTSTFTSPDGSLVAVATLHGFTYGASDAMTSTCVQSYLSAAGTATSTLPSGAFCGGTDVTTGAGTGACDQMIGWITDSSVACLAGNAASGYPNEIAVYSLTAATLTQATVIATPSDTSIYHAQASPDGKYVLYTATNTPVTTLNLVATDGSDAHGTTPLGSWTSALTSGAILGWVRPDGQLVP